MSGVVKIRSPVKQKVLPLLYAGLALSMSRSLSRQGYVICATAKAWRQIDRQYLRRLIQEFRNERLVDYRERPDGQIDVVLSEKGKRVSLSFDFDQMKIKQPPVWDGRWRIVIFDIPEKQRAARDALRRKLRELGFYEWQKSVFIHPFPCRQEIDFLAEFFEIRNCVRYAELSQPTNEAELKLRFDL